MEELPVAAKRPQRICGDDDQESSGSSSRIWVHSFGEADAQRFTDAVLDVAESDPHQMISVYIDSYGGLIDGLTAMISVMNSVPNKFVTVCTGKAMSAGAVLLSHGDIRCMGPEARVMLHEASGGASGNVNDVHADSQELQRINDQLLAILARNCGKTVKQLQKLFSGQREIYLNPGQAKKFGLIDVVGIPLIQKQVVYSIQCHQPRQK